MPTGLDCSLGRDDLQRRSPHVFASRVAPQAGTVPTPARAEDEQSAEVEAQRFDEVLRYASSSTFCSGVN
jgi:hypothetical protein